MVNNFNFLKKFPKVGGTKFWPQKPRYREVRVIERRVINNKGARASAIASYFQKVI